MAQFEKKQTKNRTNHIVKRTSIKMLKIKWH